MSSDSSVQSDEMTIAEVKIEPDYDSDNGSHDPLSLEQTSPHTDKDDEMFDADSASLGSSSDKTNPTPEDPLSVSQTPAMDKGPSLDSLLVSILGKPPVGSHQASKQEQSNVMPADTGDEESKGQRKYTCLRCGFMTDVDSELREHMINLHPEGVNDEGIKKTVKGAVTKPVKCISCNMYFPTAEMLQKHTALLHSISKKPVSKCNSCRLIFPTTDLLKKHIINLHPRTRIELKKKGDGTKNAHAPDKPLSKKDLKMKLREKKPLACDQCDFTTTKHSYLTKHKQTHSERKPYACDQCDYSSIYSSTFKRHALSHGVKPYVCELCDYTASEEIHLKRHIERDHKERKPYGCDKCDYSNIYSSTFKRHSLTLGGKPYICDLCDYAANDKPGIKRHKRRKHRGVEQCDSTTIEDYVDVEVSADLSTEKSEGRPFITGDTV